MWVLWVSDVPVSCSDDVYRGDTEVSTGIVLKFTGDVGQSVPLVVDEFDGFRVVRRASVRSEVIPCLWAVSLGAGVVVNPLDVSFHVGR